MKIGVIGLGYVGLPLCMEFGKKYNVVGFDINAKRVKELNSYIDNTKGVSRSDLTHILHNKSKVIFSSVEKDLKDVDVYIVAVPTPVTKQKKPDLTCLQSASRLVGRVLKKGNIVIYESTVFPGCTEEECVPLLEKSSGMKYNIDFYCGYSPERISPGDKIRSLTKIVKITSGSTKKIAKKIDDLYSSIIKAGTYLAPSIKVAEAAKVIENSQRDLNISFVNELALIFNKLGIDTNEVLDAAATKWNFLNFRPGLVGGHCISVDPYYLSAKAVEAGYYPKVLLSGRGVNEKIAPFVANRVIALLSESKYSSNTPKILILGITFKENCTDIRNSKVFDLYKELCLCNVSVDVHDPVANYNNVKNLFNIDMIDIDNFSAYDAVIFAVPHKQFTDKVYASLLNKRTIIYDLKNMLDSEFVDERL